MLTCLLSSPKDGRTSTLSLCTVGAWAEHPESRRVCYSPCPKANWINLSTAERPTALST